MLLIWSAKAAVSCSGVTPPSMEYVETTSSASVSVRFQVSFSGALKTSKAASVHLPDRISTKSAWSGVPLMTALPRLPIVVSTVNVAPLVDVMRILLLPRMSTKASAT